MIRKSKHLLVFATSLLLCKTIIASNVTNEFLDQNPLEIPTQNLPELNFYSATSAASWELAGLATGISVLGAQSWDWGSSSFNMNPEGWFSMDTGSGGADKVGHLYTTYLMSEWLTYRLNKTSGQETNSALYGSIFGWGLFLYIEIFDGYSHDHGFSNEDLIMNTLGAGFSYLKNTQPWLKNKIDLRVEYLPSQGMQGFHPMTDYSGYKYLAALKLSGFHQLSNTFLKYFELQLGYYTRGFKKEDSPYFNSRESTLYTAVSINLNELFLKKVSPKYKTYTNPIGSFLKYYQLPGVYIDHASNQRKADKRY